VASFKASEFPVYRAKFTPDGKSVVTVGGNWQQKSRGEIRVWDAATGKETGRFPDQSREVWDVAFLDGGRTMVTAQAVEGRPDDAPVKAWDFASRRLTRAVGVLAGLRCMEASPDGKYLALGNHSGAYRVVETTNWQVVLTPPDHGRVVYRLAFTADSSAVIAASEDDSASILRLPATGPTAMREKK
jgi:WD40 repeat protein